MGTLVMGRVISSVSHCVNRYAGGAGQWSVCVSVAVELHVSGFHFESSHFIVSLLEW